MEELTVDPFDWPADLRWNAPKPRTLFTSQFLQHYDAAPRNPTTEQVAGSLKQVAAEFDVDVFNNLISAAQTAREFNQCAEGAVRLWSSAGGGERKKAGERVPPIFKMLNRALISDTNDLKHWTPFLRALNSYLVNEKNAPKKDIVCYRGSKMTNAQEAGLAVGRVVRPCMFFAMSTNQAVAEMYTGEAGHMLELHVPSGCRNACPISHLARIEDEKECLMPPYSPLLVRGKRSQDLNGRRFNIIEVEVLDGAIVGAAETGRLNPSDIGMEKIRSTYRRPAQACIL